MKRKHTAEEKARALLAFVDGDDNPLGESEGEARVRSEEEVAEQLAAAGFDVDAERAKGQAEHDAAVAAIAAGEAKATATRAPGSNVIRIPSGRVRWILPLAAAAAFAVLWAGEGTSIVAWFHGPEEPNQGVTSPNDPRGEARDLRGEAMQALAASTWIRARDLLDQAKELDPRGDDAADVQEARRRIQERLSSTDAADPRLDGGRK